MESPIRVFLIHRYRLLTDVLTASLTEGTGIALVGHTKYVSEASQRLTELKVDIVLIEADLDEVPSRPRIRQLRDAFPDIKVVPLGLETNDQILECIEAGACGYVPLEATLNDLVKAIRLANAGKAHCSPELAVSIFSRIATLARHDEERSRRYPQGLHLTPREKEVLRLLGSGLRNKEIARELKIAVPTVKNHVHKILEKLDVRRRRDAVRMAYEMGLLKEAAHPTGFTD